MIKKLKNLLVELLLLIIVILVVWFILSRTACKKEKDPKNNEGIAVINIDSARIYAEAAEYWRDQMDQAHYKNDLITENYKQTLTENEELKQLVKKYKNRLKTVGTSATVLGTTTEISEPLPIILLDSIPCKVVVFSYKDEWLDINNAKFNIENKTFTPNMKIKNKYDIIIGDDRNFVERLFTEPKMYTEIIVHNPYSEVNTFKTYAKPKVKGKGWRIAGKVALFIGGVAVGTQINSR